MIALCSITGEKAEAPIYSAKIALGSCQENTLLREYDEQKWKMKKGKFRYTVRLIVVANEVTYGDISKEYINFSNMILFQEFFDEIFLSAHEFEL